MTAQIIIGRLVQRLFSQRVLRNDIRGEVVEEIVAMALEPEWELCAGDWAAFDLRQVATGLRMQVKQSAAQQSWHSDVSPLPRPRFSIAEKIGRWEGSTWIAEAGRNADLFVFAWHAIADATADHRDPMQWTFFVVPASALPMQKSISLAAVQRLSVPISFVELSERTEALARQGPLSLPKSV